MAEFEVESHEDFHIYLRMESAMFHDRTSGAWLVGHVVGDRDGRVVLVCE